MMKVRNAGQWDHWGRTGLKKQYKLGSRQDRGEKTKVADDNGGEVMEDNESEQEEGREREESRQCDREGQEIEEAKEENRDNEKNRLTKVTKTHNPASQKC